MQTGLVHLHSSLRWVLLLILLFTTISFFIKAKNGKAYTKGDNRNSLITIIITHFQLLIGWILFFTSPSIKGYLVTDSIMKNTVSRYWTVEHALTMTIAVLLITLGRAIAKRKTTDVQKFKTQAVFFGLGLFLILISIPWPFRAIGIARDWF